MKLYYSPGACSMATHIALNELGIAYELEKTDTASKITESGVDFRAINPKGYVPALEIDDGQILTENAAILQFVADIRPDSQLAPANGSFARVRLQELLSYLSAEVHKAYGPFFSGKALSAAARENAAAGIARHVQLIDDALASGQTYLLGDEFSVADAYAFVMLNWSYPVGFDLSPWPAVLAFMDRVRSRPSVIKALEAEGLLGEAQAS